MLSSYITVVGNVTADPKYTFTDRGGARCFLRVASTERRYDKATESWADHSTTFYSVTVWRNLAENVWKTIKRGDRVIVAGRLNARDWVSDKEGVPTSGTALEIDADVIGPELRYRSASIDRTERVRADDHDTPPAREDDEWAAPAGVDPLTGEIDDSTDGVALPESDSEHEAATVAA